MFDPQDEIEIRKRLSEVTNDVKLVLFTQTLNCDTCPQVEQLLKALVPLSDHIKLEEYNPVIDREKAEQYRVTRVPTLIVEGERDYGIRYLGVPGGYEFAALLEDIVAAGKRDSSLSAASLEKIATLTEPLDLKVFVTPG